ERIEHDGAQRQRPLTGVDRAGQISWSRVDRREHEPGPRTPRPTAAALGIAKLVALRPEDAEVQNVAPDAEQRELVVGCGDLDPVDARGHVERYVRPLVDTELEPAREGVHDSRVRSQCAHRVSPG